MPADETCRVFWGGVLGMTELTDPFGNRLEFLQPQAG